MKQLLEVITEKHGSSISFIDIDETTFHTFATVGVYRDGKLVKRLNNQEFNTYKLKDGETFNFDEFSDSRVFNKTSIPIEPVVKRIQRAIESIKNNSMNDKVIFLTARSDFNDKELFLKTFLANGIDVTDESVYVERSGNLTNIKKVSDRKKFVILKYLRTGEYSRVRMIDDDVTNLRTFIELGEEINSGEYGVLESVRKRYPSVRKLLFFPLLVNADGTLTKLV